MNLSQHTNKILSEKVGIGIRDSKFAQNEKIYENKCNENSGFRNRERLVYIRLNFKKARK